LNNQFNILIFIGLSNYALFSILPLVPSTSKTICGVI